MIYVELPATREKKTYYSSSTSLTPVGLLPVAEINRRDAIIKRLNGECKFSKGDRVRPISDAAFSKYGVLKFWKIDPDWSTYRTLQGFAKKETEVEWTDNPMIVHCVSERDNNPIVCTVNYITAFEEDVTNA